MSTFYAFISHIGTDAKFIQTAYSIDEFIKSLEKTMMNDWFGHVVVKLIA